MHRGNLAGKSLHQLDTVIKKQPDLWVALYCRGMNHLHWPMAFGHSDDAIADLKSCIELQKQNGYSNKRQYCLRTHIALGDAYTKNKQYDQARKAWSEALQLFPGAQQLKERLAISDDEKLLDYVKAQRSLDKGIDTDLSFLDSKTTSTSP
jgi:tetratricopeptide (TPR) repeat protein